MLRPILTCTAALATAGTTGAQTLQFEADEGVVIVRSYDQYGTAIVEFIGEPGAHYQCIALNETGKPIATAVALADMGQIMIEGIDATEISAVKCRRTF